MALTQVAAFEVNRAAQTTIPIPIGSGAGADIQPGDLLLISGQWANNGSAAPSVSWGGSTPGTGLTNRVPWSSPSSGSVSSGVYTWVVESGVTSITLTLAPNDDGNVEVVVLRDWDDVLVATQEWSVNSETGAPPSRTTPNLSDVPAGSLVYAGIDMASGSEAVTAVGGTVILDGDERNGIVASYGATSSAGTVTGKTFTWPTSGAYRVRTWIIAVTPAAVPTVQYANVGATTDDGFTVAVKALNADTVQVRVGETLGTVGEVDSDGWAKSTITGLDPFTAYSYDLILDDTEFNDYATTRTFPTPGTPTSFSFAFASCFNPTTISGTDEGSFDRILAREPLFWIHGGDYHYEDNTSTSTSSHVADMEKSLAYSAGLRDLHSAAPCLYSPGDHDMGGNNAFAGPYTPATVAAKLKVIPFVDRPDPDALYFSVTVGRVRVIVLDTRTQAVEDVTRLGSAQLAWVEEQLLEPEPVKVLWVDNSWLDTRPTDPGDDTWEHFDAERTTIGGYISNAVGTVEVIHGDQHCLGADDGSHNSWGGVPVISGAPFKQLSSLKVTSSSVYSEGVWPTTENVGVEQYVWVDVTDTGGDTIILSHTGYDTSDTARVELEVVAPVAVPGAISTVAGEAVAGGGVSTFAGAAVLSTVAGEATAGGGVSTFSGAASAVIDTVAGGAVAEGGVSTFAGGAASTLTTLPGEATAGGGSSLFRVEGVFATTAGEAVADGGTADFVGTQSAFFTTLAGSAVASGGSSIFLVDGLPPDPPEVPMSTLGLAELEIAYLRAASGATDDLSLADLRMLVYGADERAHFALLSGLTPEEAYSLADHMLAFYRGETGLSDVSLVDAARAYWVQELAP